MITRPVFDKILHQSSSQLLEDFGAVLGDELITDENDRNFKDGDAGNWTKNESGSAATVAYNTDSIGGYDDKQLKITAEAGEDWIYAYLTGTEFGEMEAQTYYIFSAKVYLDPNADQDRIFISTQGFGGVRYIMDYNGTASGAATVPKGVWVDVFLIFQTADDITGTNLRIGFVDTGDLTANDIMYVDDISLRKITFSDDWTAGTGWGPKFALTAPSLGDEELSNGDFGGTWTGDLPQGHTLVGTESGDDQLTADDVNDRLQIQSGTGADMGVSQATVLTVGSLYYAVVDIETATSGTLLLENASAVAYDNPLGAANQPLVMTTAGVHSIVFEAGSTDVQLYCTAAGDDFTINSWSIKPYTPSHANTYPRFSADSDWQKGTGWSIAGDQASSNASQTEDSDIYQAVGSDGTYYLYNYKISGRTAGTIKPKAHTNYGTAVNGNSVYSEIVEANGANLGLTADLDWDGDVDYCYIIPLSDPVAHCTGSQSAESTLSDTDLLTVGDRYTTAITIANRTGGEVRPTWGNNNGTPISATGSEVGIAYNNQKGGITATDDFVGDVTALTITEAPRSVFRGVFGNR
jgi:hypothetical protein